MKHLVIKVINVYIHIVSVKISLWLRTKIINSKFYCFQLFLLLQLSQLTWSTIFFFVNWGNLYSYELGFTQKREI